MAAAEAEGGGGATATSWGGAGGGNRGLQSRGLFDDDLLSLYDNPAASKSKTTMTRMGTAMATTVTSITASMMVTALTIAGWQATTKRAADSAINNQPLRKEEEDCCTSWLTPAFLVLAKTKTGKKLGSLPPIFHSLSFFILSHRLFCTLSVFSSSHRIHIIQHCSWQIFFIV